MLIMTIRRTCHGIESVEGQVSVDVGGIVQASKPDLIARGVAVDLLQMAKRVGPQYEAAEYEDLFGEKGFSLDNIITDDRRGHRAFCRWHGGTLNESTNVGVKTDGSWVGGPELCI